MTWERSATKVPAGGRPGLRRFAPSFFGGTFDDMSRRYQAAAPQAPNRDFFYGE